MNEDLTDADVEWCYRTFLNRPPESSAVIESWRKESADWHALVYGFLCSTEFQNRVAGVSLARSYTSRAAVVYNPETIVSFAQNGEDILFDRAFVGKRNGSFIDIGAGHPVHDNVTYWLRKQGWRGINVEPNPIFYRELTRYRPDDVNLNVGLSEADGELTFYQVEQNELGHGWGLSSFDPEAEDKARALGFNVNHLNVPVTTLDAIIEKHAPRGVDLIKIDVEGFEEPIIRTTNWSKTGARLICVEAVEPNSARPAWQKWEDHLFNAGYDCVAFDGVNKYYCRADDIVMRIQLSAPVCCNDNHRCAIAEDIDPP